jgi:aminoglycoside phosphotransferase (APT) family kinase protein
MEQHPRIRGRIRATRPAEFVCGVAYRRAVGTERMPAAEVEITPSLVRYLLREQHPDLAGLPIRPMANGWDNTLFRLGDELVARLPRRLAAAPLAEQEQLWLPRLAPRLPLAIPAPLRTGRPSARYPWVWSIVAFLPGRVAAHTAPSDLAEAARTLGEFLAALHTPAPADAPANPFRGVPLASRTPSVTARLDLADDPGAARELWHQAVAARAWDGPPLWLHGDLHPGNVLVHDGRISAVLDFGDLTAGDPATDLAVAWMLFPPAQRAEFRVRYGAADEDVWARAQGWALALSLTFLAHSADSPLMAGIARRTLSALLG